MEFDLDKDEPILLAGVDGSQISAWIPDPMKRLTTWLYVVAMALLIGYLASPYVSLIGFYFALKGADEAAIRERVNWESLHQGISDDINQFASARAGELLSGIAGMGDKNVKVSLTWSSSTLGDEVANILATPKGLIALFDNSEEFRCILRGLTVGDKSLSPGKCMEDAPVSEDKTRPYKLQGPNIRRWFQKLNYAFLTDPFAFRLDVLHENMRVVLLLERQGMGWVVTRLFIPFKDILGQ